MDIDIAAWFLIMSLQHLAAISAFIQYMAMCRQGFFCLAITVFCGFLCAFLCGFLCGFLMAHVCLAFAVFFLQNWLRPSRSKVCKYLSLGASCQEVQTEASDSPYSPNTLPIFHVFNVFMLTLKHVKAHVEYIVQSK